MEHTTDRSFGQQVIDYMQANEEKYHRYDGTWKIIEAIKDYKASRPEQTGNN